jgi:hypothetical protein
MVILKKLILTGAIPIAPCHLGAIDLKAVFSAHQDIPIVG